MTSGSQNSQSQIPQMNRTVQGVGAAVCGMIAFNHYELLPNIDFDSFDESYSIFDNRKLLNHNNSAKIRDHLSIKPPDFLRVYKFIYSLFRRAQSLLYFILFFFILFLFLFY
jgi:hypothetical protein